MVGVVKDNGAKYAFEPGIEQYKIFFPDGSSVLVDIDNRTPMMDVLIRVVAQKGMGSPGGLIFLTPNDSPPQQIGYKPSEPIGSLNSSVLIITRKQSLLDKSNNKNGFSGSQQQQPLSPRNGFGNQNQNHLPFEKTVRISVDIPEKRQKSYLRVKPSSEIAEIYHNLIDSLCLPDVFTLRPLAAPGLKLNDHQHLEELGTVDFVLISKEPFPVRDSPSPSKMSSSGHSVSHSSSRSSVEAFPRSSSHHHDHHMLRTSSSTTSAGVAVGGDPQQQQIMKKKKRQAPAPPPVSTFLSSSSSTIINVNQPAVPKINASKSNTTISNQPSAAENRSSSFGHQKKQPAPSKPEMTTDEPTSRHHQVHSHPPSSAAASHNSSTEGRRKQRLYFKHNRQTILPQKNPDEVVSSPPVSPVEKQDWINLQQEQRVDPIINERHLPIANIQQPPAATSRRQSSEGEQQEKMKQPKNLILPVNEEVQAFPPVEHDENNGNFDDKRSISHHYPEERHSQRRHQQTGDEVDVKERAYRDDGGQNHYHVYQPEVEGSPSSGPSASGREKDVDENRPTKDVDDRISQEQHVQHLRSPEKIEPTEGEHPANGDGDGFTVVNEVSVDVDVCREPEVDSTAVIITRRPLLDTKHAQLHQQQPTDSPSFHKRRTSSSSASQSSSSPVSPKSKIHYRFNSANNASNASSSSSRLPACDETANKPLPPEPIQIDQLSTSQPLPQHQYASDGTLDDGDHAGFNPPASNPTDSRAHFEPHAMTDEEEQEEEEEQDSFETVQQATYDLQLAEQRYDAQHVADPIFVHAVHHHRSDANEPDGGFDSFSSPDQVNDYHRVDKSVDAAAGFIQSPHSITENNKSKSTHHPLYDVPPAARLNAHVEDGDSGFETTVPQDTIMINNNNDSHPRLPELPEAVADIFCQSADNKSEHPKTLNKPRDVQGLDDNDMPQNPSTAKIPHPSFIPSPQLQAIISSPSSNGQDTKSVEAEENHPKTGGLRNIVIRRGSGTSGASSRRPVMKVVSFEQEYYEQQRHHDQHTEDATSGSSKNGESSSSSSSSSQQQSPAASCSSSVSSSTGRSSSSQTAHSPNSASSADDQDGKSRRRKRTSEDPSLQAEYDKLHRMFLEWQKKLEINEQRLERGEKLERVDVKDFQDLQRTMMEQHEKVQRLCSQNAEMELAISMSTTAL